MVAVRKAVRAGRPSREEAEALGDHVVAVADALFVRHGYAATSIATVAAQARIGKQTLYRRFPDKAALFREVIRRRIDGMLIADDAAKPAGGDPLGELKQMGAAALATALDPEFIRLYRIVIAEAADFPELAAATAENWGSRFVENCHDAIRRAQRAGQCRAGNPQTLAQIFLFGLVGEVLHRGLGGETAMRTPAERRRHLELAWGIFTAGVRPG